MVQTGATLVNMIVAGNGGCASSINIVHSNYLGWEVSNSCNNRVTVANLHDVIKPDISIMTVGAHLHDFGDFDAILFSMGNFMKNYQATSNTTFIWKTQNLGHTQCDNATGPVLTCNYPLPKELDTYGWSMHADFDALSRKRAKEFGYKIIDMQPTCMRPDSHPGDGDCLHYCLPGPLSLFSVLLMQMLYNKEV